MLGLGNLTSIHGAGGTKLPFRCNSLRRSTPAGQKAPSGPFSPLGQPARFARRLDKKDDPLIHAVSLPNRRTWLQIFGWLYSLKLEEEPSWNSQNTNFVKNVQKIMERCFRKRLWQYKTGSDKKPKLTEARGTDHSVCHAAAHTAKEYTFESHVCPAG